MDGIISYYKKEKREKQIERICAFICCSIFISMLLYGYGLANIKTEILLSTF
jgi:dolichol kinase